MTTNLLPGELAIYINYPGHDNFNFDAQAESFRWVANQRGIEVTTVRDPNQTHQPSYFRQNQHSAYFGWASISCYQHRVRERLDAEM